MKTLSAATFLVASFLVSQNPCHASKLSAETEAANSAAMAKQPCFDDNKAHVTQVEYKNGKVGDKVTVRMDQSGKEVPFSVSGGAKKGDAVCVR